MFKGKYTPNKTIKFSIKEFSVNGKLNFLCRDINQAGGEMKWLTPHLPDKLFQINNYKNLQDLPKRRK